MEQMLLNSSISYMSFFIKSHKVQINSQSLINEFSNVTFKLSSKYNIDRKVNIKWVLSEWFNMSYKLVFSNIYFYLQG